MTKERTTLDTVIVLLTATVAITIVLIILGAVVLKIMRPEIDTKGAGTFIGQTVNTIVGALVGFIGGRAAGRMEANGKVKHAPKT